MQQADASGPSVTPSANLVSFWSLQDRISCRWGSLGCSLRRRAVAGWCDELHLDMKPV